MKYQEIIFLLSLVVITLLILLANSQNQKSGKIKSITYSENKITIELENQTEKLILFDDKILNIKVGDKIFYIGKSETYRNEKQMIIDKIEK